MKQQQQSDCPEFNLNPDESEVVLDIENDIFPSIVPDQTIKRSNNDLELFTIGDGMSTKAMSVAATNLKNVQNDEVELTPRIEKDTQNFNQDYTKYKDFNTNTKLCRYADSSQVLNGCQIQQPEEILEGGTTSVNKDTSTEISPKTTHQGMDPDSSKSRETISQKSSSSEEIVEPYIPKDAYELQKLSVLRTWLIFLVFCFIFEEFALEIPSFPMLSATTKSFLGTLMILIAIMIMLIIHSFWKTMNSIYVVSLLMQVAFIMCDMKTTHHFSTPQNHIVVRNACSGRLLLMSLETSMLTALACKHNWQKYTVINTVNFVMFCVLVFVQFDFQVCGFWELAQLSSIYISAIVSLIVFSYLSQVAKDTEHMQFQHEKDQKEVYQGITDKISDGVLIITQGRVTFCNQIINSALSSVFEIQNFKELVLNSKIYTEYSLLDHRIFVEIQKEQMKSKNKLNDTAIEAKQIDYSLREIFDMDVSALNQKKFTFSVEEKSFNRFTIEKTAVKTGSKCVQFILNFKIEQIDQKEVLSFVTSNLAHQMKNPLCSIMNQSRIIDRICQHFIQKFDKTIIDKSVYQNVYDFKNSICQVNKNFTNMTNKLKFSIEDMLTYGQLKSQNFVKNCQDIDIRASILEVVEMQKSSQQTVQIQTHFYGFQSNKNPNDEITDFQDANLKVSGVDKVRLQQVISNLLVILLKNNTKVSTIHIVAQLIKSNQSSYTIKDAASEFIRFNIQSDEDVKSKNDINNLFKQESKSKLVISIVHSGYGFSQNKKKDMFKSVETQIGGPGQQSLSMVNKLVLSFDGQLVMMSQKEIGSQFAFSLMIDSNENMITTFDSSKQTNQYNLNLPTEESNVGKVPMIETNWNLRSNFKEGGFDDLSNAASGSNVSEISSTNKTDYDRLGKILVVDDEQYNLDVMKVFFEILGMQKISERVTFCQDGLKSTKVIEESIRNNNPFEYSLILTDINMPFCNGFQATQNMRSMWVSQGIQRIEQPIIYGITAQYDKSFIENAKLSGMDEVYAKPIEIDDIALMLYKMGFISNISEFKKQKKEQA